MELWEAVLAELPGSQFSAEAESMVANTSVSKTQPGRALYSWPDRLTFPPAFCVVHLYWPRACVLPQAEIYVSFFHAGIHATLCHGLC